MTFHDESPRRSMSQLGRGQSQSMRSSAPLSRSPKAAPLEIADRRSSARSSRFSCRPLAVRFLALRLGRMICATAQPQATHRRPGRNYCFCTHRAAEDLRRLLRVHSVQSRWGEKKPAMSAYNVCEASAAPDRASTRGGGKARRTARLTTCRGAQGLMREQARNQDLGIVIHRRCRYLNQVKHSVKARRSTWPPRGGRSVGPSRRSV